MKNKKYDIYKAAGIIIVKRKLLIVRQENRDFFIFPGGKVEKDEIPQRALIRELKEEVDIVVRQKNLVFFNTFYAEASKDFPKSLRVDAYKVLSWEGEPVPNDCDECIKEILWIDSKIPKKINLSSILEYEVVPKLKKLDLID
jgi:8-oxo-dGTP diphosphatase